MEFSGGKKLNLKPESGYHHSVKNYFVSCSFQNITVIRTCITLFCTLFCLYVKRIQTTNVWKNGVQENIQMQKTDCPI